MTDSERYMLGRKRIVNVRLSEAEYNSLRSHASAQGVALSHLMRLGLQPYIRPQRVEPETLPSTEETEFDS